MTLESKLFEHKPEAINIEAEQEVDQYETEMRVKNHFENLYAKMYAEHSDLFESVRRYKSDGYFHDVNELKRKGEEEFSRYLASCGWWVKKDEIGERIETAKPIIEDIENFLSMSKLPETITVYRKISRKMLDSIKNSDDYFEDNGFVSTCYTLQDAKSYHKEVCIKIIIPAGTEVIDMTSALKFTDWSSSAKWENELVIGDGYKYKINKSDSKKYELILNLVDLKQDSSFEK